MRKIVYKKLSLMKIDISFLSAAYAHNTKDMMPTNLYTLRFVQMYMLGIEKVVNIYYSLYQIVILCEI